MIASFAARGLTKLQDPRAVDELIAAGREMTGEALAGIVQSLIYFSEPRAQAAAEELLPPQYKDLLKLFREERKTRGMRALFQW